MTLTVRFRDERGWLAFMHPRAVLRAATKDEALAALAQADHARRGGAWIAGVVTYEWAGTVLGIFDAPSHEASTASRPFALSPLLATVPFERYRRAIETIARQIYDGDVYQVNYTVPFELAYDGDARSLWEAIALATNARYQAFVEDGERRILSWSPELFLAFDRERVTTKPMKGTAPPHDLAVLHDEKNRAEHVMIVDLLRNDLQRVCSAVAVKALCSIEQYPTFATMTSTIEGTLDAGATLDRIFAAAFPCGSVTGAPKISAMRSIAALETRHRGSYCGSVGFLSPQRTGWWNVAIRTAQFDGNLGRFDAGGGIVADSKASGEWNEIHLKSAFLAPFAGNFRLWETFSGEADDETLEAHLRRLLQAARRFTIDLEEDRVREAMHAARSPASLIRMRIALDGSIAVERDAIEIPAQPVRVCVSRERVRSDDPWLQIKSSWRPAHERARQEARARGCFDALLVNEAQAFTEGCRTNLFVEIDDVLYTPPVTAGLLPGILRARLIEQGRVRERALDAGDLRRASAVYIGNSARGLLRAQLLS